MDFGKITVPTKWEEVTLKQFTELLTIYDKENKDILDIISMFTGRDKDELRYRNLKMNHNITTYVIWELDYNEDFNVENYIKNVLNINIE